MNNRILILGSLGEFEELTKKARSRDIYTVVCDGNPDGPAKKFADAAYDIGVTDVDAIAELCIREGVDGVITAFSDLLLECMVKICERAHLPCYLSEDKLPLYRDKRVMKEMFISLGIDTPRFAALSQGFSDEELTGFEFPVVAKPVDMYGSRGITIIYGIDELREKFNDICRTSAKKEVIVEEYNGGFEFNVMSWLLDGELFILGLADREKTSIGSGIIPISTRNVYPSRFFAQLKDKVIYTLNKIASYTGQRDGELSMQFFWRPGEEICVGEVAARFLGYEHELIEYAGGFSIEDLLLDSVYDKAQMIKKLRAHDPAMKNSAAVIYFQAKDGTVESTGRIDEIIRSRDVVSGEVFYKQGDRCALYERPYAARVCVCSPTRKETDEISLKIIKEAAIHDKEGNNLLYKNEIGNYVDC